MNQISIVVPVYNAEVTIGRCIESLINQTFKDIEIILIDDGSNDKSGLICDLYASKDERIVVIHKTNEGVSKARNVGIERAQSRYLMFVDSDDYIMSSTCDVLFNAIEDTNYDMAVVGYQRSFIYNGIAVKSVQVIPNCNSIDSFEQYIKNWSSLFEKALFNAPWGKLYKMDYIKKNKILFNEDLFCGEDLLFNLTVLSYIHKIAIVNEACYFYQSTEVDSLSNRFNSEKDFNDRLLYNVTLNYLTKLGMKRVGKQSVALIYIRSCFRTFEQLLFGNNGLNFMEIRSCVNRVIYCKETTDAVHNVRGRSFESLIYMLILNTKNYYFIRIFTKIRLIYKNLYRKGWRLWKLESKRLTVVK